MEKKKTKYIHTEDVHNFKAAEEIIPFILSLLHPKSVVDVGCGIGTWLKVFKDNGVTEILGIDSWYVDKNDLKIDSADFIEYDLEESFKTEKKFDLAISLEVAEHLNVESADVFVKTLSELSDVLIFSAAIPNQGGQNHINEKEPEYWINKFKQNGFNVYDVLRPIFWKNPNVDSWYKQNILVFSKNQEQNYKLQKLDSFLNTHLVHPEILKAKENVLKCYKEELNYIFEFKHGIRFYFTLFSKALVHKIKDKIHL